MTFIFFRKLLRKLIDLSKECIKESSRLILFIVLTMNSNGNSSSQSRYGSDVPLGLRYTQLSPSQSSKQPCSPDCGIDGPHSVCSPQHVSPVYPNPEPCSLIDLAIRSNIDPNWRPPEEKKKVCGERRWRWIWRSSLLLRPSQFNPHFRR